MSQEEQDRTFFKNSTDMSADVPASTSSVSEPVDNMSDKFAAYKAERKRRQEKAATSASENNKENEEDDVGTPSTKLSKLSQ